MCHEQIKNSHFDFFPYALTMNFICLLIFVFLIK